MKNHYSLTHLPHGDGFYKSTHHLLPHPETIHFIMSFAAVYWSSSAFSNDCHVVEKILN